MTRTPGQGRKPKPPQLRIADGTHRNDRHGQKKAVGSEKVLNEVPKPPTGKGKNFQKWWKHYAGEMLATGTLTARDIAPLEVLCDAQEELAAAMQTMDQAEIDGMLYLPTMGGAMVKHPVFTVISSLRKTILTYQLNLGFTPTGRSKVPPSVVTDKSSKVQGMNRKV